MVPLIILRKKAGIKTNISSVKGRHCVLLLVPDYVMGEQERSVYLEFILCVEYCSQTSNRLCRLRLLVSSKIIQRYIHRLDSTQTQGAQKRNNFGGQRYFCHLCVYGGIFFVLLFLLLKHIVERVVFLLFVCVKILKFMSCQILVCLHI